MHQPRSILPFPACKTWLARLVLLALFLYIPNAASHALLNNGNNAQDLLGQIASYPGSATVSYTTNPTISPIGFNSPRHGIIDSANDRLFIADTSNNRVLVYNLNSNATINSKVPANVPPMCWGKLTSQARSAPLRR